MSAADALMWTAVVAVALGAISMIVRTETDSESILWKVANIILVFGGAAVLIASFWGRVQ